MTAKLTLRCCIASTMLLQGCATQAPPQLLVHPALQVRHSSNETSEAYYQLGRTHQQQGNLDLALTGYTYAIARDARHMEARTAAAAIHAQQGRLDQARAMMLSVIADYPLAAKAHNNLGYIDYLRGEHALAAQSIRRSLELDPLNRRAQNNARLVDTALAMGTPASTPAAVMASVAVQPVPAAAVAAPEPQPTMSLVQVVPNVYELKLMPKAAAPVVATAPAQAAALPPAVLPMAVPPVPAPQFSLPAVPAAPLASTLRLDVANGDGTPGLARRVGVLLGQHGYPVARLSNERPYGQRTTRIQYRDGYAQQAEAVARLIDGPVQLAPVQSLAAKADVRVVLGRDTQRAMAQREGAAAVRLATR